MNKPLWVFLSIAVLSTLLSANTGQRERARLAPSKPQVSNTEIPEPIPENIPEPLPIPILRDSPSTPRIHDKLYNH